MKPLSEIAALIIARLQERRTEINNRAADEVSRLDRQNRALIEKLEAGERKPMPQTKQ